MQRFCCHFSLVVCAKYCVSNSNLLGFQELLALEERIGNVSTGLSGDTILNRLKQRKYFSIAMSAHLEVEPCCVCQVLIPKLILLHKHIMIGLRSLLSPIWDCP